MKIGGLRHYRALLRLLPRTRRARFGDEMAVVFADLCAEARRAGGRRAEMTLWFREVAGMFRFSMREVVARIGRAIERLSLGSSGGRWNLPTELRWAWRGVRARGWSAVVVVVLLATALAANTAMFSVADSLLINPQPYPDADRIVQIRHRADDGERIGPLEVAALLAGWEHQPSVFQAVGGYLQKTLFININGDGPAELVRTADVTVGLFDLLGLTPRWGRGFVAADLVETGGFAVTISESLARRRFGRPERAVGQRLEATAGPLFVVGVMPDGFAFPRPDFEIWRALDPAGPLTRNSGGVFTLARMAPGVSMDSLPAILASTAPAVGQEVGLGTYRLETTPFARSLAPGMRRTLLSVLLGAAACLLLAACANVSSLELASALRRSRAQAIQLALGARRLSLARVAGLEGAMVLAVAWVVAVWWTSLAIDGLQVYLPDTLRLGSQNPIRLDDRVLGYSMLLAVLAWACSALAPVIVASRATLAGLSKQDDRTAATPRSGTLIRRVLTVAQVGVAVVLIIGGLLYARSYRHLLAVEKGFDSDGLLVLQMNAPATYFASAADRQRFLERLISEIRTVPGVVGVSSSPPPPGVGDSPMTSHLEVDGTRATAEPVGIGLNRVDPDYFAVVGLPLVAGRLPTPDDPPGHVVIPQSLARRFWSDRSPVGSIIRGETPGFASGPFRIIGVVADFRSAQTQMPSDADERVFLYVDRLPSASQSPVTPLREPQLDTGGSWSFVAVTIRVERSELAPTILAAARRFEPRLPATLRWVDDLYASQNAETLLATQIVIAFSVLAFVVAMAGLYGVMAFLVAGRTREIGIRMALGAGHADVCRMVLGSSLGLVLAGAALGCVAAIVASRWIAAQLFGVSPTDPLSYLVVTGTVVVTALVATWHPARQAAHVDPAVTLRAE